MTPIEISVVVKTTNPLNNRRHWRCEARERKVVRGAVQARLHAERYNAPGPPLTITITRLSAGKLDDDNLAATLKSVRDGVQDWLGIDDGSDCLTWRYAQEKCKAKQYGVRVHVARRVDG